MNPIIVILLLFAAAAGIHVRSNWVYNQRIAQIDRCVPSGPSYWAQQDKYVNSMLSYSGMMLRFWIWDIEKLRRKP